MAVRSYLFNFHIPFLVWNAFCPPPSFSTGQLNSEIKDKLTEIIGTSFLVYKK